MRDARINMIGEGANDVLRAFIALVGMRDVGLELKGVLDALQTRSATSRKLGGFAGRKLEVAVQLAEVHVAATQLEARRRRLGRLVGTFGSNVERLLRTYQEAILDRQYQLGRVADAATSCTSAPASSADLTRCLNTHSQRAMAMPISLSLGERAGVRGRTSIAASTTTAA